MYKFIRIGFPRCNQDPFASAVHPRAKDNNEYHAATAPMAKQPAIQGCQLRPIFFGRVPLMQQRINATPKAARPSGPALTCLGMRQPCETPRWAAGSLQDGRRVLYVVAATWINIYSLHRATSPSNTVRWRASNRVACHATREQHYPKHRRLWKGGRGGAPLLSR